MNDTQMPDGWEEVTAEKNMQNLINKDDSCGTMARASSRQGQTEIGLKIFFTFIAVYGFLAFLNPRDFPITRLLLVNTQYFYISQYDQIFGLILIVVGLYLLQEK